jgi:predicted CoA-binding protein
MTTRELIDDFLAQESIAVAGVSRDSRQPANAIYRRLAETGHEVWAVNPRAERVEETIAYPDLSSLPRRPGAVMIVTPPDAAADVVRECADLGVSRVWFHRSFGEGSVSDQAVSACREHGITAIVGGCPMMYCTPDVAHRCMRWVLGWTGGISS